MNLIEALPLFAGMFAVTFGVRYGVLVLAGRHELPEWVQRALNHVPVAVLTALVVPMLLRPEGAWWIGFDNPWLLAGAASGLFAACVPRMLLTIVFGMSLFLLLRNML